MVFLQNPELLVTEYVLPVTFGLAVMPEEMPFGHTLELRATLEDVGEMASCCSELML